MKKTEKLIQEIGKNYPLGFDLSLKRIEKLLGKMGNPQDNLPPTIHVAGTNGKGSTIAVCKSILEENGMKVNVHTSPHLVDWTERYYLGGENVNDELLAQTIEKVMQSNANEKSTVFEILTATMFVLFEKHKADVCLIEVGLGGRFDATNVMKNAEVQVITPIGIDHEEWLGDTLAKIAGEKCGIMRENGKTICAEQKSEAKKTIEEYAKKINCEVDMAQRDFIFMQNEKNWVWERRKEKIKMELPLPTLIGKHQMENAGVAVAACLALGEKMNREISHSAIKNAMGKVKWEGRLQKIEYKKIKEKVSEKCEVWIDGGHNAHAATALAEFLIERKKEKEIIMICAMLTTKKAQDYFRTLEMVKPKIITMAPEVMNPSGESNFYEADELAKEAEKIGLEASTAKNFEDALEQVSDIKDEICLVASGSLYFIGDILKEYGE